VPADDPPRDPAGRNATRWIAAVAGVLLGLLTALPAAAHAELTSSSPRDGERLSAPPTEVVLTFSDPLEAAFTRVAVVDDAGAAYQDGDPTVSGGTVTQPVTGLDRGGRFTITYRVVSADGHPVTGDVRFLVAAPSPTEPPLPSPAATTPQGTGPATTKPAATAPSATDEVAPTAAAPGDRPMGVLAALSVAAAAIGVAAYAWSRRRLLRGGRPPEDGPPTGPGSS
jgi:methionine-rich copper-binding protein CopC